MRTGVCLLFRITGLGVLVAAGCLAMASPVAAEPIQPVDPAPDKAADTQTELVRAAVTIALDGALQNLIEEITRNVLGVLEVKGNGPRTNADKRG